MTEGPQTPEPESPRPATAGGAVLHMASARSIAALERMQAQGLLAGGQVCVITLDTIAERLGDRWVTRQGLVWDHAERELRRQVGPGGFIERISATNYLVAQPGVSRLGGQATCMNALRAILHHFLGEAPMEGIRVHEVTRVAPEGLYGERLDVAAVEEAEVAERAQKAGEAGRRPSLDQWSPFVASDGRRVRVSCALEPVILLKTSARIGYRMARRVLDAETDIPLTEAEQRNLSRADIERIDYATITRGLDRLRSEGADAKQLTLVLPVSYVTLSSQRGRAVLASLFREAKDAVRHGLICEICDVEGVPTSALLAAAAMIRPFCVYVVGRLNETPGTSLAGLSGAGLRGLTVELPRSIDGDAEFLGWAKTVLTASRPIAKSVMFYRLSSMRQAALAGTMGATHISLRAA